MQSPQARLTISGVALPYGVGATLQNTTHVTQFAVGCFDDDERARRKIDLVVNHRVVAHGHARVFTVRGAAGDRLDFAGTMAGAWATMLADLAAHGAIDRVVHGVSVGWEQYGLMASWNDAHTVRTISRARLEHISLQVNDQTAAFAASYVRPGQYFKPGELTSREQRLQRRHAESQRAAQQSHDERQQAEIRAWLLLRFDAAPQRPTKDMATLPADEQRAAIATWLLVDRFSAPEAIGVVAGNVRA